MGTTSKVLRVLIVSMAFLIASCYNQSGISTFRQLFILSATCLFDFYTIKTVGKSLGVKFQIWAGRFGFCIYSFIFGFSILGLFQTLIIENKQVILSNEVIFNEKPIVLFPFFAFIWIFGILVAIMEGIFIFNRHERYQILQPMKKSEGKVTKIK